MYNLKIGRNTNTRFDDYSSILKYKNPKIYSARASSPVNKLLKKNISKSIFPIMFHDVMLSPDLIFDTFKNSKIIYIDRHPVDMVTEWYQKGYYGKIFLNNEEIIREKIISNQQITCGTNEFNVNTYKETLPNGRNYIAAYSKHDTMMNTDQYTVPMNHYLFLFPLYYLLVVHYTFLQVSLYYYVDIQPQSMSLQV